MSPWRKQFETKSLTRATMLWPSSSNHKWIRRKQERDWVEQCYNFCNPYSFTTFNRSHVRLVLFQKLHEVKVPIQPNIHGQEFQVIHHFSAISHGFPIWFHEKFPNPTSPIIPEIAQKGVIFRLPQKPTRPTSRCPKKTTWKHPSTEPHFDPPQKFGDGRLLKWIVVGFFHLLDF